MVSGAIVAVAIATGWAAGAVPLAIPLAIGGCATAWLVIRRPDLMLALMVAATPWESDLLFPTATLTTVKALGLLLVISYLVKLLTGPSKVVLASNCWLAIALVLLVGYSLLFSPDPAIGALKVARYAIYVTFFLLVVQLVDGRRGAVRLLRVLTVSSAAAGFVGLIGVLLGHHTRATGPIQDPNDFAYALAIAIPPCVYLMVHDRRFRFGWGLCLLALAGGTLATLSRGAFVGLAGVALLGLVTRRIQVRVVLTVAAVTALIALGAVLTSKSVVTTTLQYKSHAAAGNVASRQQFWGAAIEMGFTHPLFGVGPNRFGVVALNQYLKTSDLPVTAVDAGTAKRNNLPVQESYLEILAEDGILAAGAFIGFLLTSLILLERARREALRRDETDFALLATCMQASLLIAVISGAFISVQLQTPFWILGGLATVLGTEFISSTRRPYARGCQASSRMRPRPHQVTIPRA